MKRIVILACAYLAGAIPFSNLLAGRVSGVDLRRVGSGTVSGTGLYRVAGFRALATAGLLDIAKGASVTAAARRLARASQPAPLAEPAPVQPPPDQPPPEQPAPDRPPVTSAGRHWRPRWRQPT